MFQPEFRFYDSKPTQRKAYEIKPKDTIYWDEPGKEASLVIDGDVYGTPFGFVAHQEPKVGDFVCYLKEDDVYHVPRDVFLERNVVPGVDVPEPEKLADKLSPEAIEATIAHEEYFHPEHNSAVTICVLTLKNGFVVTGKSAPVNPSNFDVELGKSISRKNAVQEIWMLEGYLLKQKRFEQGIC